jgi:hypothetical protein
LLVGENATMFQAKWLAVKRYGQRMKLNLLRVVGSVFANALGRKRTDRKLLVTNQVRT